MKHYKVVAAIIINNEKILCVQRNVSKFVYISKKYEFPGGKVEPGETEVEALEREIYEELEMKISVQSDYMIVDYVYPDFEITMHSYICHIDTPSLTLTEHMDFRWLSKDELGHLDWAAADIPIVKKLMKS